MRKFKKIAMIVKLISYEQELNYFSRLIKTVTNQQLYWGHSTFYCWSWGTAPCAVSADPEIILENLLILYVFV